MLGDDKSIKMLNSFQASPRLFPSSNNNDYHQYSNLDLFDNNDIKLSRRNSNLSATPKLLIDDYMNVSKSPSVDNYKISGNNSNYNTMGNKEYKKQKDNNDNNDNNEVGIKVDNYFD